jgi:hypothetical protein
MVTPQQVARVVKAGAAAGAEAGTEEVTGAEK